MKKVEIITDSNMRRNRPLIKKALDQYGTKDVVLTIEPVKQKRSNRQNSYYWGVIIPIVRMGLFDLDGDLQSVKEVHEMLKYNFNYKEIVNEETSEVIRTAKSSTTNSTQEMERYHENIRRFALEFLNIEIPLPNKDLKLFSDEM